MVQRHYCVCLNCLLLFFHLYLLIVINGQSKDLLLNHSKSEDPWSHPQFKGVSLLFKHQEKERVRLDAMIGILAYIAPILMLGGAVCTTVPLAAKVSAESGGAPDSGVHTCRLAIILQTCAMVG